MPKPKRFFVARELDDAYTPARWMYVVYDAEGNTSTRHRVKADAVQEAERMNFAAEHGRV